MFLEFSSGEMVVLSSFRGQILRTSPLMSSPFSPVNKEKRHLLGDKKIKYINKQAQRKISIPLPLTPRTLLLAILQFILLLQDPKFS